MTAKREADGQSPPVKANLTERSSRPIPTHTKARLVKINEASGNGCVDRTEASSIVRVLVAGPRAVEERAESWERLDVSKRRFGGEKERNPTVRKSSLSESNNARKRLRPGSEVRSLLLARAQSFS